MGYEGVKFKTVLIARILPGDKRIDNLRYWCREFARNNLAPRYDGGSFGNLSFRVSSGENRFIITASGVDLGGVLDEDCFCEVRDVDLKKRIVYASGKNEPSSESMLHCAIYNKRPDVMAIFHGHFDMASEIWKKGIPITKNEAPYGTIELVNEVISIVHRGDFLIMKNHGFLSLGKSMDDAGKLALEICCQ